MNRLIIFLLYAAVSAFAQSAPSPGRPSASAGAIVGQTDDGGTFTREMIEVRWNAGDPIYLYLVRPKLAAKPAVILYLYSFPSDLDRYRNDEHCRLLAEGGFAAVGFVSALTGHRYHDRPMKEWFISELPEALGTTVDDVKNILDYLATRGDIDMGRVGMFGQGSGATIAIQAAAIDSRIKVLDLVDPWGDWPDWMAHSSLVPEEERSNYLKDSYLKSAADFDPLLWFPRVKAVVRLQSLSASQVTPKAAHDRIWAAAPGQTKVVPYAEAIASYKASAGKQFLDWIKNELRPAANAPDHHR